MGRHGYPRGFKGEDIPLAGRITAVADVFDALTTVRPYKDAWPSDRAFELLKKERGRHFDPDLVDFFGESLISGGYQETVCRGTRPK